MAMPTFTMRQLLEAGVHFGHHTRRWNRDHREELHSSWLNGTGMLVWDVVFGVWVGWNERDTRVVNRRELMLEVSVVAEGDIGRMHYDCRTRVSSGRSSRRPAAIRSALDDG